jgi:hypothetical protein
MMEEAPSRLPSHDPEPEAFMRYFQPPTDTRFYAGVDLHAAIWRGAFSLRS